MDLHSLGISNTIEVRFASAREHLGICKTNSQKYLAKFEICPCVPIGDVHISLSHESIRCICICDPQIDT